jgi:putative ATP-dependent endonuclease of OLD family
MYITKVVIKNFKCFEFFEIDLKENINIIVGDNEAGKSTIIEALHLALSGMLNGRYLNNDLNEYIFNKQAVEAYLQNPAGNVPPPELSIEIYIDNNPSFLGDKNSKKSKNTGFTFRVFYDEKNDSEYNKLISSNNPLKSLPIEYYKTEWISFARENITTRSIPIKSALINSASSRYQNGSDIYITKIVKEFLEDEERVNVAQEHRSMHKTFEENDAIKNINKKLQNATSKVSDKSITLSVDLSSKNAWETSIVTNVDGIPFHNIGKGEQCLIKTKLSLEHNKKVAEANILLLEEPENHLSHTKLNVLLKHIKEKTDKQIIITTHSSFVANKLNLSKLIFVNDRKAIKFNDLTTETQNFFEKLSGYDTLRLILSKKTILVEGPSDELIVEKAFQLNDSKNRIPIEAGVDIISVGLTFKNFLDIAERINKKVVVITDNDGKPDSIKNKYFKYIDKKGSDIFISYDETIDTPNEQNGNILEKNDKGKKVYNYNTLEPKLVKANNYDIELFNNIFNEKFNNVEELLDFMRKKKTECALMISKNTDITKDNFKFPEYINKAIEYIKKL